MVDFGNILKSLRLNAGLSQKELADQMGVTKSVISYYELQERTPSPEIIKKLACIFHVSADYLLGIENPSRKTIDVTGLDEEDIKLLLHTAEVLRSKNKKTETP